MLRNRKVIITVSEDWYFLSHRFELARHLVSHGWEVVVATQVNTAERRERMERAGIRVVHLPLQRGRMFAVSDFVYCSRLLRLYRREKPAVVHHVAMKPILFGSLAALAGPRMGIINAFAGMGYLFTENRRTVRVARFLLLSLFRKLFRNKATRIVLQNQEDVEVARFTMRVPERNVRLIRGTGIDVKNALRSTGDRTKIVVTMGGRMLRDKGVLELIAAARELRQRRSPVHVRLVGALDEKNPNSLSKTELVALTADGSIVWEGFRNDMAVVLSETDIAVLPSYREGLPRFLIEAACAGLPIVATDIGGCREIVEPGVNGILVPVKSSVALVDALEQLITNSAMRKRMGNASRQKALREFDRGRIFSEFTGLHEELLTV